MNELIEFIEILYDNSNPTLQVLKLLNFAFRVDRVTSEKIKISTELKRIENLYDRHFNLIAEQIIEIRNCRENLALLQEKKFLERIFLENTYNTLLNIFKNEDFEYELRTKAFEDSHIVLKAIGDSFSLSLIEIQKFPTSNIEFGSFNLKLLE